MPYIPQNQRPDIDIAVDDLIEALVKEKLDDESALHEGMLNYAITRLLMKVYGSCDSTRYAQINNAIGMLECCKLEFYRTVAAPYEDQKAFENGEVVVDGDMGVTMNVVVVENE